MLVLVVLSFLFIPEQQNLYLQADFELLKNKSGTLLTWTIVIGALIILFLALKKVENINEAANVLLGVAALAIPFYFIFQTPFLSAFLILNRIEVGGRVDKKYTTALFLESDQQTPMIFDFRTKKILSFEKVRNTEKLKNLKSGDTVIISFSKGLLGFTFDPGIK
ncbi:MAG: hypothetical protein WDO71_07355 [Bacteroidota bacterium]